MRREGVREVKGTKMKEESIEKTMQDYGRKKIEKKGCWIGKMGR